MTDARRRPPWDWPACPRCESPVFVEQAQPQHAGSHVCRLCQARAELAVAVFDGGASA